MKPNKSQLAEVPPAQKGRKARIQPHIFLGVAVSCLAAGAFVAYAATGGHFSFAKSSSAKSPVPMKSGKLSTAEKKAGAKPQLLGQTSGAKKGGFMLTQAGGIISPSSIVGGGQSGNNLTEYDLTPNTQSDEREASFSPNGEYVVFRSNGVDANNDRRLDATGFSADGKYHIWVGKFQTQTSGAPVLDVYQVTGKNAQFLSGFDQFHPTWSINSGEIAFVSSSTAIGAAAGPQIYRMDLNLQSSGVPNPLQPYNITSFAGPKESPTWSVSNGEIVFAAKSSVLGGSGNTYDIFRIGSKGETNSLSRITGGPNDAAGETADDRQPAFSLVQQNAVYFSSNRIDGAGRRIYIVRNDGSALTQVTDPLQRPYGVITDNDEYPVPSRTGVSGIGDGEVLAFQSNTLLDQTDNFRDRNIWGVNVDSTQLGVSATAAPPRLFISAFSGGEEVFVNPPTDTPTPATRFNVESGANRITTPEGALYYENSTASYVYVSSRNNNRVERLDAITGAARPASGLLYSAFTPKDPEGTTTPTGIEVPNPSGLATDGQYLYVASGTSITTAVYRYDLLTGRPQGTQSGARFTFGEPAGKPLGTAADGTISEGIAINKAGTIMYVSNYAKDRINIYAVKALRLQPGAAFNETGVAVKDVAAGQWLAEIVAPTSNLDDPDDSDPLHKMELLRPTGVAIGPDISGDEIPDLYVSSSGIVNIPETGDDILAFALTDGGSVKLFDNGDPFKIVIHDDNGENTGLDAPEGIRFDSEGTMYVSSYRSNTFNRYKSTGEGDARTYSPDGYGGSTTNAQWIRSFDAGGISGPAYFDFNPAFKKNFVDFNAGPISPSTFIPETYDSAFVITNVLSSAKNYQDSDLDSPVFDANGNPAPVNVTIDQSADIEATFGRADSSTATIQSLVRVVFSSNRRFAPTPSSNLAGATPSNPYGGEDNETGLGDPPTSSDLWITVASDVEAPVIQPEQNNYPMLSPSHESTSFSNPDIGARTPRGPNGLTPGGIVKLALLAKEKESGLGQVSFAFHNAEDPRRFVTDTWGGYINNDRISAATRREADPSRWPAVVGFDFDDAGMTLDLSAPSTTGNYYSDEGPRGNNPERQSNAVAGDGIYYLAKTINAPTTPGDYYISVRMSDRSGNSTRYYFIWGFSTRDFNPQTSNDLFVSDNTAGQAVESSGRGSGFKRLRQPVESHYLTNWGANVTNDTPYIAGTGIIGAATSTSIPTTFPNVDVWRVLCRGPLYEDLITNYIPATVTQINPDKFDNGFQVREKLFADVQRVILWASPYAGTAEVEFDIPGSIKEGATKEQLKRLLAGGGRLFLTGRNILTALEEGGADNSFRAQELYVTRKGKTTVRTAVAINPTSGTNAFPEIGPNGPRPEYSGPQFAWFPSSGLDPDFRDASYSHANDGRGAADAYDEATPEAGVQLFQAYASESGGKIGQRIIKRRSTDINNGLESRVVFFSFSFDGVNRRYISVNNIPIAIDVRRDIADGIRIWFKTGGFSGNVVDNAGQTVANALVAIRSGSDVYFARTDANGFYELKGLPAGRSYTAEFVFNDQTFDATPDNNDNDANDRDDLPQGDINRNYITGSTVSSLVSPSTVVYAGNIRVEKLGVGSVTGKVATYKGDGVTENPLDRSLHSPIAGIQVMLKAATETQSSAPYARITVTNATGDFAFADAPKGTKLKLILNPKQTDVPAGSDLEDPNNPNYTIIQYNDEFGRRVIPLDGDKRRQGDIITTQNDTFEVNDTYVYDSSKVSLSDYPTPPVDTAASEKDGNGFSLPVVLTRGEPISGKFNMVAGVDTPVVGAGWKVKLIPTNGANNGVTRETLTTADGSYAFDEVVKGIYEIEGEVPASIVNGYDALTAKIEGIDTTVLTDVQKASQNLTAKISHIVGAVRVNGEYASGATVTLQTPAGTPVEFGNPPVPRKGTSGNISGGANYFIGYVPNGTYKLVAQLPNGGSSDTIDPVVIDSSVDPLKVLDFNFTISELSVNVSTAYSGLSKAGATVEILNGGTAIQSETTDANGNVIFRGIPNGTYQIKASNTLFGVTSTVTSGNVTVTQASLPTVNLTLKWDSLGGIVKVNGTPKSGAKVQFLLGGTEVAALTATTAGNGTYQAGKNSGSSIARPLAAGTYTVRASIVSNGLTLSKEQSVTISSPFTGNIISVPDFNFQESYLTGQVRFNGQPTSGFQVTLVESDGVTPYEDSDGNQRSGVTDANGIYRIYSVPIGENDYKIKVVKVIGAYTATATISGPTIQDGVTQAQTIEITSPAGLSGQVRVNGEGTAGATVQVLTNKKKPLSPPVVIATDANGRYFVTGLVDGSYYLQAAYSENGVTPKPINKSFKIKNGVYKPTSITFDFKVTRLKGLVLANGKPAEGARVILLDKKGKALKQTYAATTDATGNYLMSGVKSGTYRAQATFAGSTGFVNVKVSNLKTTVAPTINLVTQELVVKTEFRVGNSKIGDAPGATVEILSSAGNALGSAFVKVTDTNSQTSFFGLGAGSYRARVTMQGYSTTTPFTVEIGLSERTLPITLSQIRDLLILSESNGLRTTELGGIDVIRASLLVKPTQDVQVTLTANTPSEATFLTGNSVTLTFTSDDWNAEQQVTVVGQQDNVSDGDAPFSIAGSVSTGDSFYDQIPDFVLSGTNFEAATIPSEGPTFPANSKNLVSTPFTHADGTITVEEVFGSSGYTLYRFNSAGQQKRFLSAGNVLGADWIAMSGSSNMERGRGYLLVTGNQPVTMQIPANPTVFAGDSFAVDVVRNPNYEAETGDSNINNGWDIIGFPFDPTTVSGVDILQQAQVLVDGVLYPSFLEAAGAGKISNRIYGIDNLGRPVEITPANSSVRSYKGYFVKIFANKAKIIMNANPSAYNGGDGGSGGTSSASVKKTSVKKS
jgi:hypothetical protein